jgi:hypothetical protein
MGPAQAESFFKKLPQKFVLADVRKVAGKATGVSIAQWVRSKRIRKTTAGYEKAR